VVYIAAAIPSLINPIEDLIIDLSLASSPAIGASMMMNPMIAPALVSASGHTGRAHRLGSKISPLPSAARSPARRRNGRRNNPASFALAWPM
jgi:hypothetical protein